MADRTFPNFRGGLMNSEYLFIFNLNAYVCMILFCSKMKFALESEVVWCLEIWILLKYREQGLNSCGHCYLGTQEHKVLFPNKYFRGWSLLAWNNFLA